MSDTLLLFQVGPVQEFIAQARSTRDLWSGSYLLSWMTGHVIHALQKKAQAAGPGNIRLVFPQLQSWNNSVMRWNHPMMQWIDGHHDSAIAKLATLPTVPNRFLACLPDRFTAQHVKDVIDEIFHYRAATVNMKPRSEWERVCKQCWQWYEGRTPKLFA